jgi:hypothetical protein
MTYPQAWRMKSIPLPLLATGAALMLAACHSYQPLQAPAAATAQTVRVQFSQPQNLVAARVSGGDSVLVSVSALQGRVVTVSGDTLKVSVARLTDTNGDHAVPTSLLVSIVHEPSVAIDVLAYDENRSGAAAGITLAAVGYGLLVVTIAAILAAGYR